jgi:hypothetical protein
MHQLHLNDQQDFDDFPDDDHENQHHHPTFEVYDDDDLFLDSEDDDGFLSSEEEDEFLDTDEEEGRMDGVDVLGYPWPEQMGGGVDDCLDEPDHQRSGGHHEVLDFDNEFDNLHDHEPEHPIDPSKSPAGHTTSLTSSPSSLRKRSIRPRSSFRPRR